MKISCCYLYIISKYGYPPKRDKEFTAIREIANLGYTALELEGLREEHLREVSANRQEYKKVCTDLGLKIINFCPIIPEIVSLDKTQRDHALDLFNLGLEIANFYECETIQLDSFAPPFEFIGDAPYREMIKFGKAFKVKVNPEFNWQKQWDVIVESISKCNSQAKKAKLKLLMEPRVGEMVSTTDGMLRLIDAVKDKNLYAVLDTGHLHGQKEIIPLSIEKLGDRIGCVHASDNDAKTNAHWGLGKGNIDWEAVLSALKKHRYSGYIAVDIGEIANIDVEYSDSKKYLEQLALKLQI